MIDPTLRRHGLEPVGAGAAGKGVEVRVQAALGFLNLRGNTGDRRFGDTVAGVLGQPLPLEPNTTTAGEHRIYWLGPDEWLIVIDAAKARALTADLHETLNRVRHAVNNVSGGNVALRIAGPQARDVLATGCTLDFHPRVFGENCCAQSTLAKAGVLIGLVEPPEDFEIIVRRSFADYLLRWLLHASDSNSRSGLLG